MAMIMMKVVVEVVGLVVLKVLEILEVIYNTTIMLIEEMKSGNYCLYFLGEAV